jgi:hypothetical protein
MVVGDSITYGLGVRDWRDTWPEVLARRLERELRPHEFAVFALPGQEMPQHAEVARRWAMRVSPDILIYQWYVNDIEDRRPRPDFKRPWHRSRWNEFLRQHSYFYFLIDHRLQARMHSSSANTIHGL